MGTNRVKWVIVGVIVVIVIIAAVNRNQAPKVVRDARVQEPDAPAVASETASADTAEETLRTVQAQYGEQRRRNDRLQDEIAALRKAVETSRDKVATVAQDPRLTDRLSQLETRLDALITPDEGGITLPREGALSDFGFTELAQQYRIQGEGSSGGSLTGSPGASGFTSENTTTSYAPAESPGYVRLVPLVSSEPGPKEVANTATESDTGTAGGLTLASARRGFEGDPLYTIPARSTLFDSTAMTALIGRVPVGGQVHDPFPVKIIVGQENLAANGHAIPGIDGIVFDGIARGDWSLSCVSVQLTGATYIHADGTITHMSARNQLDPAQRGEGAEFGRNNSQVIGYVSDPQGVPCIRGDRITDAYKQAALLGSLGVAQGYAEYRADSQRSTVVSGGAVVESLTGEAGEYSKFGMAATGLGEVLGIFKERLEDTFDAIYVPPGQSLAIHVSRDLIINHSENARRIHYASMGDSHHFDE